jgi:membrane associated rhomboid family serine protease
MATAVTVPLEVPNASSDAHSANTPICNALSVVLPATYIGSVVAPTFLLSHFAMVPVNTFLQHRFIWNLVTHICVESSALFTGVNVAVVLFFGRTIERELGTQQLALFLTFVAAVTAVALLLTTPVLSAAFNAPFVAAAYSGFLPGALAIAIATFQRAPDSPVVTLGPNLALRASTLPLLLLLVAAVVELLTGPGIPDEGDVSVGTIPIGPTVVPAFIAFHAAWFYLRFMRGAGGDPSVSMAYDAMFPGPLRVLARSLGRIAFPLVRCCGLGLAVSAAAAKGPVDTRQSSSAQQLVVDEDASSGTVNLPGSNASVADRRRQVALAALAERLQRAREQHSQPHAAAAAVGVADEHSTPSAEAVQKNHVDF